MFLIRLCFCIVCVDAVAIVFSNLSCTPARLPCKTTVGSTFGCHDCCYFAYNSFVFVTNYSKYEPICICNRIINNK